MTLQLHPTKGLNPHLTVCPRCGGDTDEIILLGNSKAFGDINDWEKVTSSDFCKKCKKELAYFKSEVEKGGIYWKCDICQCNGVIKQNSLLAQDVRKVMDISAPNPCGIDFTNDDNDICPGCNKIV